MSHSPELLCGRIMLLCVTSPSNGRTYRARVHGETFGRFRTWARTRTLSRDAHTRRNTLARAPINVLREPYSLCSSLVRRTRFCRERVLAAAYCGHRGAFGTFPIGSFPPSSLTPVNLICTSVIVVSLLAG